MLESTSAVSQVGGRQVGRVFWSAVTSVCRREAPCFHGRAATGRIGIPYFLGQSDRLASNMPAVLF